MSASSPQTAHVRRASAERQSVRVVRPCGCAESAPHELVRLSLPIVRGLQRLDQLDGARALVLQLGKYSFRSSHLVRVRACCGLWRAMREVFEVEVVQVVGPAVRRLRGGSFVCASGVLAVDVAAILRHDSWASAIVCHTSSRRDTRLGHTTCGCLDRRCATRRTSPGTSTPRASPGSARGAAGVCASSKLSD